MEFGKRFWSIFEPRMEVNEIMAQLYGMESLQSEKDLGIV